MPLDEKKVGDFRRLGVGQAIRAEKRRVLEATPHTRGTPRVWVRVEPDLRRRYSGVTSPSPNLQNK